MSRMERQAKKTDLAVKGLGDRLDKIGGSQQLQRMERTERALKNIDRAGGNATSTIDRHSKATDRASKSTQGFTNKLIRMGAALTGVTKVLMLLKLPLFAAAIGVALQAVSALSAGVVALIPNVVQLAGAAGALPATFLGIGLSVIATKLAFSDLTKAMGGNKKALQQLTPEGRQFLDTLKSFQPIVKDLRRSAQQGLFPGLDRALNDLKKGVPMASRLLNRAGRGVGNAASNWASSLTKPGALRDISRLGNQGIRIFDRMQRGALSLVHALIDVGVAAEPFTDWLTTSLLHFTRFIEAEAQAGRESGRLTTYFQRTRRSLEQMASIGGNLWHVFKNLGHASRVLGDDLWKSIDGTTERWAKWTGSLEGQNELARWFANARAPLHELAGLVGDIGSALFHFNTGGLTATISALRGSVPAISTFFEAMSQSGPAFAHLLTSTAQLGAHLSGALGPIALLLTSLQAILDLFNQLIENVPVFGSVVAAAITVAGIAKLRTALMGLAQSWMGVGRAASGAAAAQNAAVAGGAAGGGFFARMGGGAAGRVGTIGGSMSTRQMLAQERALMRQSNINPNSAGALRGQAGTILGGAGTAGRGALGAASKFLLPIAAFGGALGALQGSGGHGAGGFARNVLSGATMGLIPSTGTGDRKRDTADMRSLEDRFNEMTPSGIKGTRAQIATLQGMRSKAVRERSGDAQKALTSAIDAEIAARRSLLPVLRQERAARSLQKGGEQGADVAKAFRTDLRHGGKNEAFKNLRGNVLGPGGVVGRDFPGARQVAQAGLAAAREAAKGNPKLQKEYDRLERGVRRRFDQMGHNVVVANGRILSATAKDWPRIRDNIAKPSEQARQRATTALSAIQQAAIGALKDMGYGQKEAQSLVRGARGNASALPAGDMAARSGATLSGARTAAAQQGGLVPTFRLPGTGDGIGDGGGDNHAAVTAKGGGSLMGAKPGLGSYAADAANFGLHVSSGLRPGSITNAGNVSFHSSGDAIDLAGPPASMLSFAKHAADVYGPHLEELIHTPMGFAIKNGARVAPYAAADHYDHVHLADKQDAAAGVGGGGLGAGGNGFGLPPQLKLAAPKSGVQGVSGTVADAAMAAMAKGLEGKINGAIGGGSGGTPGGGVLSFEQVARLAESVGLPGVAFAQIAKGESGFNPSAIGHDPGGTRGLGLWQITTQFNDDIIKRFGGEQAMLDPMTNAMAAKAIYDRQGIKAWYGTKFLTDPSAHFAGDGVGWGGAFAEGGSMRVRRPTLFMAGERGDETVRVQRSTQRGGGGSRRGVTINGMVIHNHRAGDIEEQIRDEVDRAFANLGDEMDGSGVENEDALL